ncbi:hypothetical protein PC123_g17769 [Phytophthora cactorum]|nr:hypothetical protein PC120_g16953 [Phytophthora cactorum]KAG4046863.1 hypothetical protein PC123_g17769 [Phytophthora cactorum]
MNCYGWVEWTVKANLHLMFCENALARRYTNLEPISVETLRATMEGVTLLVEAAIGDELPDGFDLMLDGWSHASEHYVAVFAWDAGMRLLETAGLLEVLGRRQLFYFALLEFLDAEDEDIMDLPPSPARNRRLKKLHAELKDIESVSKALQAEDVNLLYVRVWFDELIAAHPAFVAYTSNFDYVQILSSAPTLSRAVFVF